MMRSLGIDIASWWFERLAHGNFAGARSCYCQILINTKSWIRR
jgi:hypothetical protein